ADQVEAGAELFVQVWDRAETTSAELVRCVQRMFHEVSLSPHTEFVPRTLAFLQTLREKEPRLIRVSHPNLEMHHATPSPPASGGEGSAKIESDTRLARTGHGMLSQEHEADLLAWLVRQIHRHLNAYDLVTFHHRGA